MRKQYLLIYGVSSYDGTSGVAVSILAKNDKEAEKLAERAFVQINKNLGTCRAMELFNLTDGKTVKGGKGAAFYWSE